MKHAKTLLGLVLMVGLSLSMSVASAAGEHATNAGIGELGEAQKVTRTVAIEMTDALRFTPAEIQVKRGETIHFVLKNLSPKQAHEFVLGTEADLKDHAKMMLQHPNMKHEQDNQVSLPPQSTKDLIWRFTKSGKVAFACLVPSHYELGMKGAVRVK